jgi:hypothetical protein
MKVLLSSIIKVDTAIPYPFKPVSPNWRLTTDASLDGWGATLGNVETFGSWSVFWKKTSINVRELQAILLALYHWEGQIQDTQLIVYTDNATAAAVVRKRGSARSLLLSKIAERLDFFCLKNRVTLCPAYVPGALNVRADALSRLRPRPSKWSLSPSVFQKVCNTWGMPEVDLCATRDNKQVPVYVSPLPTDQWRDCLTLDWSRWKLLYALPPNNILLKFLQRAEDLRRGQTLILIFPWWPKRPWFPLLQELAFQPFIPLNIGEEDLSQVTRRGRVYHPNPGLLSLHAVRLLGNC